jgi:ATP-binding cassette subfamily B (MDR/TAP) protein 1
LAIARALARNNLKPSILILDEATASLDGKNEEEIQKVINEILQEKNCTIIVVAHRLSTIKNADVIHVLANGRVEEKGTHDELLQLPSGIYKSMLNA